MDLHLGRRLVGYPQNRDSLAIKRVREHADLLDHLLESISEEEQRRIAAQLGLGEARGPNRLASPVPTRKAWRLGEGLARDSLEPLSKALGLLGGSLTVGIRWRVQPPSELPQYATIGLPLLAASSPDAMEAATKMLVARALPPFEPIRDELEVRLAELIAVEDTLWQFAAEQGGPSGRIPYAFAFRALEWFWSPKVHAGGLRSPTTCLRCGAFMLPRGRIGGLPLCAHCTKNSRARRQWPDHAIAPAGRGTWWLACLAEDCSNAFVGQANFLRCPNCRLSRVSPSKRKPLPTTPYEELTGGRLTGGLPSL
jgi:hypothetical protein